MTKSGGRSEAEVEQVVLAYERSGLNRREYSEQKGIAVSTLDWYRRRVRASRKLPALVPVRIREASAPAIGSGGDGFTLVLSNGHRIEADWSFSDAAMTRLIRIAGAS